MSEKAGRLSIKRETEDIRKSLLHGDDDDLSEIMTRKFQFVIIKPLHPMPGVPFGLELLVLTENIFIRPQEVPEDHFQSLNEVNHYDIIDLDTGRIYFAWENNVRGYGKQRLYNLKVVDFLNRPVLEITNETTCLSNLLRIVNCVGSSGGLVKINKPDGTKIAQLVQNYNGSTPKFTLKTGNGHPVITIMGPKGSYCCCNRIGTVWMVNRDFPIYNDKEEKIGIIKRGSPNVFENEDVFGVEFPQDLAVEQKAGILGSVFAINSMFFDRELTEVTAVEVFHEKIVEERKEKRASSYKSDLDALGLDVQGRRRPIIEPSEDELFY